jgi:arylsulfatase A-like enzyme
MKRVWIVGLLLAACLGMAIYRFNSGQPARQNVLLVTFDTTRADHIGAYGYRDALTPAMDDLAANGTLFERAYAPAPLTLPSHATMLTGLYPPEHGLHANGESRLGTDMPTLAGVLKEAGYQTGAFVGSFVLAEKFGLSRGFNAYDDSMPGTSGGHTGGDHDHRQRSARDVTDQALQWLEQHGRKPFFCWVHYYDPHHPYMPHTDSFGKKFESHPYDAEIAFADSQLARLLKLLETRGLTDRTVVVVAGDHGESLSEHDEPTHAYTVYDSTIKVPLIIREGSFRAAHQRITTPVSLVDVFPTVLECVGVNVPKQSPLARSLQPALRGNELSARLCYSETEQPWREGGWAPLHSIVDGNWKYIRTPRPELYDLKLDPNETANLAETSPDRVRELDDALAQMEQRMETREAPMAGLTRNEERALQSLGYVADGNRKTRKESPSETLDIKDMLPWLQKAEAALVLMNKGNHVAAEPILQSVVDAVPTYAKAQCNLAICLAAQARYNEAEPHFQVALKLDPDSERLHEVLGITRLNQKRLEDARYHFEAAVRLAPASEFSHLHLGNALQQMGKLAEARDHYETALKLNPKFGPAHAALRSLLTPQ